MKNRFSKLDQADGVSGALVVPCSVLKRQAQSGLILFVDEEHWSMQTASPL